MQRTFGNSTRAIDVRDRANVHATSNGEPVSLELDALIIGAGFAGVYLLHRLRQEGYKVKIAEAGTGLGGIWHWNNYPGARVDSQYPIYQLSIPEVYKTWQFREQYPGAKELQDYFRHADKVLDISKDTLYNTRVIAATWEDAARKWSVECENGTKIKTNFLHCCLGFAAKRHVPDWPGLDKFDGFICHSSFWPEAGIDMKGKKVGVVGQGATGIQIAQESAKVAGKLSVFIRTPNTALAMKQGLVDQDQAKKDLPEVLPNILHKERFETMSGFIYPTNSKKVLDDTTEKRERAMDEAAELGGFRPLFCYSDIMTDEAASRAVYDWWAKRTRARISNPVKRDILAPLEPYHAFAAKRPSLEQDYYEMMDQDHVELVNLKDIPVSHVVPEGIVTADGKLHELDILAMATGFDSLTGSFNQIKIEGVNGLDLERKWGTDVGALAYMGISISGFPNLFYTYGPLAPTAYGNGPSVVEPQCEWIVDVMNRMKNEGKTKINAKEEFELDWKTKTNEIHAMTLRDKVDSWYMGSNIPGKPRQALNYAGGLPGYRAALKHSLDNNFEGFEVD